MEKKELQGKHILVTGASSGIGREVCIQASRMGARITLVARNEEKMRETRNLMSGEDHEIYCLDLHSTELIADLVDKSIQRLGPIDGFVHSAGYFVGRSIKQLRREHFDDLMVINVDAFAEFIRCFAKKKNSNEGASFLAVSSVAAKRGDKSQGAYAAAKGALESMVPTYAKELATRKIRINSIVFGMVDTVMYEDYLNMGGSDEKMKVRQYLGVIPKEYAAGVICFMLSDTAKYMTGTSLVYDGGSLS